MSTPPAPPVQPRNPLHGLTLEAIVTALEANQDEVLTDEVSKQVRASFAAPRAFYLGAPRA